MAKGWPSGLSKAEYKFYKEDCISRGVPYLGAHDYRDKKQSGEIEDPEGFVAPAKVINLAKKTKVLKTIDDIDPDSESDDNSESMVITVDVDGYWGFTIGKRDMSMYKRDKYKTDDFVVIKKEDGSEEIKEIKAGEWQEWKPAGTYFVDFANMFNWVKRQMLKTELKNNGRLDVFADALKRSEERVIKTVNPKYVAK